MSARDILDVLNVQRDELSPQPAKKRKKLNNDSSLVRQTGMARELYSLLGPNTPPVHLSMGHSVGGMKEKMNLKPSPWTKIAFTPGNNPDVKFSHWLKGSRELLELESAERAYFFDKFDTTLELPELVSEELFDQYMEEFADKEEEEIRQDRIEAAARRKREAEKRKNNEKLQAMKNKTAEAQKQKTADNSKDKSVEASKKQDESEAEEAKSKEESGKSETEEKSSDEESTNKDKDQGESDEKSTDKKDDDDMDVDADENEDEPIVTVASTWTYDETKYLWNLCKAFELKWPIIHDRYEFDPSRSQEELKEQFYRLSAKALDSHDAQSKALIDALELYSKGREVERKHYLENLLKRTPAEIAEEESLVIEARRFELAAKKMLIERSHLLTLLDSPQSSQPIQQYNSSQGLATLYNNLMIMDKNQKKKQSQLQKVQNNYEPVPPAIPVAASSSFKKERVFQTPLQQHLAGVLKSNQHNNVKLETNSIQQLLMKRLTQKEEEAYGLHYHSNDKLNPGVLLRSAQRLPGLQQRQSVLKSVSTVLQELDIPTGGGTNWKPIMPTRKTMAKYDELIKSVVALLEMKKGKDRLESEIRLIKTQKGLE